MLYASLGEVSGALK